MYNKLNYPENNAERDNNDILAARKNERVIRYPVGILFPLCCMQVENSIALRMLLLNAIYIVTRM